VLIAAKIATQGSSIMHRAHRLTLLIFILGAATCALSGYPAHAVDPTTWELPFSWDTSDETDPALLDATWTFTYTPGETTFDVTIENQTTAPAEYDINRFYFNINPALFTGDLSLDTDPIGTGVLGNIERADGYGMFDFEVDFGGGNGYGPGTETFSFSTDGAITAPNARALFDQLSTIPPGSRPRVAVIKWIAGPGDDSAFSSTPEPCTLLLLAASAGFVGLAKLRRRKA